MRIIVASRGSILKHFQNGFGVNDPVDSNAPLEMILVQVAPSLPSAEAVAVALNLTQRVQLELSTLVPPRWLAELLQCLV